jgi:hypothetical protein
MDPATMLIISGITKGASALFSLGEASRAKSDLKTATDQAQKYIDKAYQSADVNTQRMRSIDASLYDTASEQISQDLSTVLDVTAGEDPRLAAAQGSRLAQQSAKQRQALEMQKRKDIQDLEKDIAEGEQARLTRIANLDIAQAKGFQQQAAEAQQRMTQGRQQALQAPASLVGDYTAMITAGVSPMQIQKGFEGMFAGSQQAPLTSVGGASVLPARTVTGGSGMGSMSGVSPYLSNEELENLINY